MSFVLLVVVSMSSFSLLRILPGDFAQSLLMHQMGGELPSAAALDQFKQENGFYQPLPMQYLQWLGGVVRGDLGTSFLTNDPVLEELKLRIPNTLILAFCSVSISLIIAVPLGVIAALNPTSLIDRAVILFATISMSIPNFWLSILGILLFSLILGWLPVSGYTTWAHLILPSVVIGTSLAGATTRMVRTTIWNEMSSDYVRTAHAKGLSRSRVVFTHAFPNAMTPIITLVGLQMGKMFDNVVIVEAVFGWPGIGRLFAESILDRDFPVMQGCILVIGLTYILINLIIDFMIGLIDPRVRGVL